MLRNAEMERIVRAAEAGGSGDGGGLSDLLRSAEAAGAAPLERWSPPYCGDIGLAIAADGTWSYRGSPILRDAIVKLFARVMMREPDGRFYLVTPAEKVDVRVADAPFVGVEMEVHGEGRGQRIIVRTNVGDVVEAGEAHPVRLIAGADGFKPYVAIRRGLEALLSRPLAFEVAGLVAEGPGGLGVWSAGCFFPVIEAPSVAPGGPERG